MTLTERHAYLIIAHKDDECLRTLLKMIDDHRNDIFIHMDLKCKDYHPDKVVRICKINKSHVFNVERTNVTWGGMSLIMAELSLLKKATSIQSYQYYHLLSGQDLPIKSQNYIHHFFNENIGKEFVHFCKPDSIDRSRISLYHLFQEKVGRRRNVANNLFLKLQMKLGVERYKKQIFYKGSQWFSITDDFARHIVEQSEWIKRKYKYSFCCDEVFIQTLLMESPFINNRYWQRMDDNSHANMRLIVWKRGKPYVFNSNDWQKIISSDMLFCRKFDTHLDSNVVGMLEEFVNANLENEN